MDQYSRKEFITMTGVSIAALCGLSMLSSCSGVQRKDLSSALLSSSPSIRGDILKILQLASLAPSGHNTQPWTVHIDSPDKLIVGTDKNRWLPNVDPDNREIFLSIGAFLENLSVAAQSLQYRADIRITAITTFDTSIAVVTLQKDTSLSCNTDALIARRVVRQGYQSKEISVSHFAFLSEVSASKVQLLSPSSRQGKDIGNATLEANRILA